MAQALIQSSEGLGLKPTGQIWDIIDWRELEDYSRQKKPSVLLLYLYPSSSAQGMIH